MNLSVHSKQAATLFNERIALEQEDRLWTYSEFDCIVDRLASSLAHRYEPLSRIGVMMSNRAEAVFLQFALERAGLVRVPVNARYTGRDLRLLLGDCSASAVFYDNVCQDAIDTAELSEQIDQILVDDVASAGQFREMITGPIRHEYLHRASIDDLATINYTSGTTGTPKGVMLTHRNWCAVYRNMLVDRDFRHDDVVAFVGPLTHSAGAYLAPWFWRGARNIIVTPPAPEQLLDLIEKKNVTAFTCVPTFLTRLINAPQIHQRKLSSLRFIGYGAEPIPVNTLEKSWELFGPILWQNYGQTEAMMTCVHLPPNDHVQRVDPEKTQLRHGYIGRPYTFVEVVLRDANGKAVPEGEVGELTLRGDHVMKGYWNKPQQTDEVLRDGWLWTGDLAVSDGPGLLRLVGRRKDMLICGGFNIYPAELEALLTSIEGVHEAAVIAREDSSWGEIAVAFVTLLPGSPHSAESLAAEVRPLAGIKTPKAWHIIDELPMNPNGKLDRGVLRQWDLASLSSEEGK